MTKGFLGTELKAFKQMRMHSDKRNAMSMENALDKCYAENGFKSSFCTKTVSCIPDTFSRSLPIIFEKH